MPRLRRLSGLEVVAILESLGFTVKRVKGSHYRLWGKFGEMTCYVTIPAHGSQPLPIGTLRAILRQIAPCVPEEAIRTHFYTP